MLLEDFKLFGIKFVINLDQNLIGLDAHIMRHKVVDFDRAAFRVFEVNSKPPVVFLLVDGQLLNLLERHDNSVKSRINEDHAFLVEDKFTVENNVLEFVSELFTDLEEAMKLVIEHATFVLLSSEAFSKMLTL